MSVFESQIPDEGSDDWEPYTDPSPKDTDSLATQKTAAETQAAFIAGDDDLPIEEVALDSEEGTEAMASPIEEGGDIQGEVTYDVSVPNAEDADAGEAFEEPEDGLHDRFVAVEESIEAARQAFEEHFDELREAITTEFDRLVREMYEQNKPEPEAEPLDEHIIAQLRSHAPEDPYIIDAIEYFHQVGEAGYKTVAEYAIEAGDGALARRCFDHLTDPVERWRIHALAHERKDEDVLGGDYETSLGEARAAAEEANDLETLLSIETSRLREELSNATPTEIDRANQTHLLNRMTTFLQGLSSEELSQTSRRDVAEIIGSLVRSGRTEDVTERIIPALPANMHVEAQELTDLHRALNQQMNKKELNKLYKQYYSKEWTYEKAHHRPYHLAVQLLAAGDERAKEDFIGIASDIHTYHPRFSDFTDEFIRVYMPECHVQWGRTVFKDYDHQSPEECADNVQALIRDGGLLHAWRTYAILKRSADFYATPQIMQAQLRAALHMAHHTVWYPTGEIHNKPEEQDNL